MPRGARIALLVAVCAVCAAGAIAAFARTGGGFGTIAGKVTVEQDGKRSNATGVIVYVVGFTEKPPKRRAVIHQKDKVFRPDLIAITAGQKVSFPNDDDFFHNVFSPSPTRKFDLGQYPAGETKSKTFPSVGIVDIFCNIHPEMAATILVLPNRRFTRVSRDGTFRIGRVPEGTWDVYAYSRRAAGPVKRSVTVRAGETATVSFAVDEPNEAQSHKNKFGETYRDPEKYRSDR